MSDSQGQTLNIYDQLGVLKDTPAEDIHKRFVKLVLGLTLDVTEADENYLDKLQNLWVAHDILIDPSTRTDYDLRALGIQTGNYPVIDDSQLLGPGSNQPSQPPSWRLGELLLAAALLEQPELDIATDMHKAVPEMQFGRFLVKQGFVSERQVQAALIGQALLREGKITLSQFSAIMIEVNKSKLDIKKVVIKTSGINKSVLKKMNLKLN